MNINDIRQHARNPRKINAQAMKRLKASIQRDPAFMILRPIVVDGEGIILGGNQRWLACKELGMVDLPDGWVIRATDLTPEQRKRFILVDNAPAGMAGEWDMDTLKADWGLPELAELGFDVSTLQDPASGNDAPPQTGRDEELKANLIYLAVPYSHPDAAVRESRFNAVNRVAARLMKAGTHVFSPISHTHPIALVGDLPTGWDYWAAYDRLMLSACEKLVVLMLDGWRESTGVQAEIDIAKELGMEIVFIEAPLA